MNEPGLRDLVNALHERLGAAPSLDAESRDLLRTTLADIEQALGRGTTAARPLADRLEQAALGFEAGHPTLFVAARQLIDALGKAGI